MADLILHHYDVSPYSEKIRTLLGYKNASWKSVDMPRMAPKPDQVALTGGYRGTPVLQIGADIYCDTELMVREIEQRLPAPALCEGHAGGAGLIISRWVTDTFFFQGALYALGSVADALPDEFLVDRAKMLGLEADGATVRTAFKADAPNQAAQAYLGLSALNTMLTENDYLFGDKPSHADFSVYHPIWMLIFAAGKEAELADRVPAVLAWTKRMGAIGHGSPEPMDASEAHAVAKAAEPATIAAPVEDRYGVLALGKPITAKPKSFGTEESQGVLVSAPDDHIVMLRETEEFGRLHVHYPRHVFQFSQ
ncbi:MAG: glutathione S-transferase family protein [Pseudomonadota bacterium]